MRRTRLRRDDGEMFRIFRVRQKLLAVAAGGPHDERHAVLHVERRVRVHRRGEGVIDRDQPGLFRFQRLHLVPRVVV